jgi:SAM-dependent methyltransferase
VGGPILELACGTGRLTIPLALDGHEVVSLDASHAMLRSAREKADAECVEITFVHADMRSFAHDRRFALVIISCNSLAHLTTNEELKWCLHGVAKHLVPGGLLAFDVINPNLRELLRPETQSVRLDVGPNPSAAVAVEEVATYDPVQQIRVAQWRILDKTDRSREIGPLRLRVLYPQELSLLLDAAGFELAARYGDFEGSPLSSHSLNQICLARHPIFASTNVTEPPV